MRIESLTPREMVRIDRAIAGRLKAATKRAFPDPRDALHDLDVQVARIEPDGYVVFLTELRSEEDVAWAERYPVENWGALDDAAKAIVMVVHKRCALAGSPRFREARDREIARLGLARCRS